MRSLVDFMLIGAATSNGDVKPIRQPVFSIWMYHPAKELERGVAPVTKRFGGLRRIGLHKTGVAVRQVHRTEVDLALDLGDLRQRLAEIHLRMARIVPQWHEHLAMPQPLRPHVIFNDGDPAGIAVLVAKPFEDPLRGTPLLSRSTLIRRQDPVNDPGKPIQLRTRRRPAPQLPTRPSTSRLRAPPASRPRWPGDPLHLASSERASRAGPAGGNAHVGSRSRTI